VVVQVLGLTGGILLVRILDQQEYAYFTIANTMQGTMNVLADSGISYGLTSIGGKVWQDRYRFGQLINTAMQLRRYLAAITIVPIASILLWVLIGKGASTIYAILITVVMLVGINFQLTTGVLGVVPRLHSQLNRVQNLDLIFATSRLTLLGIAYFICLNAAVAIFVGSIAYGLQFFFLNRWVVDSVERRVTVYSEYQLSLLKIVKHQAPNAIFYCIQGQLTIWLISIFGSTQNVAEVGALGRLGVFFSVISAVMSSIVLPSFARCQSFSILCHRYWQTICIFSMLGLVLVGFAAFFPRQLLWILGERYAHLQNEVLLMVVSTVFQSLVATMWSINSSKAWIQYSWLYIPSTILTQILLLLLLDVATVKGVIIFSIISTIPAFLLNATLTYRGLHSYNSSSGL
jgi:O-antigen/teichoic acid export membrane protein